MLKIKLLILISASNETIKLSLKFVFLVSGKIKLFGDKFG